MALKNSTDEGEGEPIPYRYVHQNSGVGKICDEPDAGSFSEISSHPEEESMSMTKIPYPKSVFFIIVNEFCERFSYYGMKAVLTLYLINELTYTHDAATVTYHVFSMLCYFTPLLGAMIADSFLGKFRTILYLSIIYAFGNIVLALAATPPIGLHPGTFSLVGLGLIALGTGGIKPCVSAFGGDQFILPQQEKQLSTFFSIFYFAINAGSLISTFITPIFRNDIHCFDRNGCYPLAFGVPAVLMVTALVIFVVGKPWYKMVKPSGNILMRVSKCIAHAVRRKHTNTSGETRAHFLDYADDKYERPLIEDIKILLRILVLYLPLPLFWALFDQQGSRWTIQATGMDGRFFGWFIKPDQMQVVNPFLILALIPIFDQFLYPAFERVGFLTKPLQRLTVGGILAGVAFIISAVLELHLQPTYAVTLGASESQLNFINTLPCSVNLTFTGGDLDPQSIESFQHSILSKIPAKDYEATISFDTSKEACKSLTLGQPFKFSAEPKKAFSYVIEADRNVVKIVKDANEDELEKSQHANAKLKLLISGMLDEVGLNSSLVLLADGGKYTKLNLQQNVSTTFEIDYAIYHAALVVPNDEVINRPTQGFNVSGSLEPQPGGNYVIVLKKSGPGEFSMSSFTITEPNSVHMLWLLPQYIVITIAEVMFSVTGLEFSFSQAPLSMKSVIQAAWLLTVAFGNLIVVFITEFVKLDSQASEFFLFSGLMFVDMIVFAILAYFYKPAIHQREGDGDDLNKERPGMEMQTAQDNKSYDKEA